jgi:hypothetical protein
MRMGIGEPARTPATTAMMVETIIIASAMACWWVVPTRTALAVEVLRMFRFNMGFPF